MRNIAIISASRPLWYKWVKIADSLVIGLEATSAYGEPLVLFLKHDADISPFKPNIHVLNPKQVNAFKKAFPDLPKTDDVDAWVIAENLRFGRINQEVCMDDRIMALRKLTRASYYTARNLTRGKNHFLNTLFLKFSSLAQEKIFAGYAQALTGTPVKRVKERQRRVLPSRSARAHNNSG